MVDVCVEDDKGGYGVESQVHRFLLRGEWPARVELRRRRWGDEGDVNVGG